MVRPSRCHPGLASAVVLGLLVACGGDEVTGPGNDRDAPGLEITAAPEVIPARVQVAVAFTATDEVALESIECSWGVPGTASDLIEASGRSFSESCTHVYDSPGEYTVVIQATDAAGNETTREHTLKVGAPIPTEPTSVGVSVIWNQATVWWTPEEAATSQRVVVSHASGLEPDRVVSFADAVTRTAIFSDLSWDASYEVVVMALNESGRAESAPVSFEVPMTDPPALTGLYSPLPASSWYYPDGGPDPTCLVVEWEFASLAESYRIALSGMSGGETFDVIVPAYPTETSICAADHPIVDGMNYRAQVFAVQGDEELGSNSREYTIDFDMGYPATGTWLLVWYDMGYQAEITLELEDRDGEISGSWTTVSRIWENGVWQEYTDVWSVTGRRLGLAVELTLDKAAAGSDAFAGYFDGPDRLRLSLYKPPFTFTLLSFDRR